MVWGIFFEYCVRHGVSLRVFLEYVPNILGVFFEQDRAGQVVDLAEITMLIPLLFPKTIKSASKTILNCAKLKYCIMKTSFDADLRTVWKSNGTKLERSTRSTTWPAYFPYICRLGSKNNPNSYKNTDSYK